MRKENIVEIIIGFILITIIINLCILGGLIITDFETKLLVFFSWFLPLIGVLVLLWYFEEY